MAFLLNEPDIAADADGACACVRLLEMKTYLPVSMRTLQYIPTDLPLEAFMCSFGRCRGGARVHHFLVPANWRGRRAELWPQCCPIGWHPRSYTAHSSMQSPGAGEHGQCQEVRLSLTLHFPRMQQLRLLAALYSARCFCSPTNIAPHVWSFPRRVGENTPHVFKGKSTISCTHLSVTVLKHNFKQKINRGNDIRFGQGRRTKTKDKTLELWF